MNHYEVQAKYRSLRTHGESVETAARRCGFTVDRAYRIEGRRYCDRCYAYVTDEQCAHWDYES